MLVTHDIFERTIRLLKDAPMFSLDTETTGLYPYKDSRMFSIICSTERDDFYFNFNWYPEAEYNEILTKKHREAFKDLLGNPKQLVFMHNAKFDMHILSQEGIDVGSKVHCTEAVGRIIKNDIFPSYSLDALAKRYLGVEKDNSLKEYLDSEGHYSYKEKGKQKVKDFHYWKAPLERIVPYGEKDGRITFDLGALQIKLLRKLHEKYSTPTKSVLKIYANEIKLTKTLFEMERGGIKIDKGYTEKALEQEIRTYKKASDDFTLLTGMSFTDSAKGLKPAFDKFGISYGRTAKGNASFKKDYLTGDSDLEGLVRTYRDSYKRANSYYRNFLSLADRKGYLHTNFRQGGTGTGRISATEPALQTLPKPKEDKTGTVEQIRRCFIPSTEEHFFYMPDYDQMEYRFFIDRVNEEKVIEKILAGMDVHEATAAQMGVERSPAKTLNFMLLYGGGIKKLGTSLGISEHEAKILKAKYFSDLPNVARTSKGIVHAAELRGYVMNWMGRISWFEEDFYKAPNYIVQGGTADIVKIALNKCHGLLKGSRSRIVLQVHDEIVFEIHREELHFCPMLQEIMETSYPYKKIRLTCGAEHSWKSLADKVKGLPVWP
jgi:DNA polymerase-1